MALQVVGEDTDCLVRFAQQDARARLEVKQFIAMRLRRGRIGTHPCAHGVEHAPSTVSGPEASEYAGDQYLELCGGCGTDRFLGRRGRRAGDPACRVSIWSSRRVPRHQLEPAESTEPVARERLVVRAAQPLCLGVVTIDKGVAEQVPKDLLCILAICIGSVSAIQRQTRLLEVPATE